MLAACSAAVQGLYALLLLCPCLLHSACCLLVSYRFASTLEVHRRRTCLKLWEHVATVGVSCAVDTWRIAISPLLAQQ